MTPKAMIVHDICDAMDKLVSRSLGGISGSRADASSQQVVSTKGFDPGRKVSTRESGCANNAPDSNQ